MEREKFQEIFERLTGRKPSDEEVFRSAKLSLTLTATENEIWKRASGPANVDLLFLILHSPALREISWTLLSKKRTLSFTDYTVILEAPLPAWFHRDIWKRMKSKLGDKLDNPKLKYVACYAWNSEIQTEARMLLTCPDAPSITTDHFPDTKETPPTPPLAPIIPIPTPSLPTYTPAVIQPRRSATAPTQPVLSIAL